MNDTQLTPEGASHAARLVGGGGRGGAWSTIGAGGVTWVP